MSIFLLLPCIMWLWSSTLFRPLLYTHTHHPSPDNASVIAKCNISAKLFCVCMPNSSIFHISQPVQCSNCTLSPKVCSGITWLQIYQGLSQFKGLDYSYVKIFSFTPCEYASNHCYRDSLLNLLAHKVHRFATVLPFLWSCYAVYKTLA